MGLVRFWRVCWRRFLLGWIWRMTLGRRGGGDWKVSHLWRRRSSGGISVVMHDGVVVVGFSELKNI